MKCHICKIVQDDVCNIKENATVSELILSLPSANTSSGRLIVYESRSKTNITVDDSREPECCKCAHLNWVLVGTCPWLPKIPISPFTFLRTSQPIV